MRSETRIINNCISLLEQASGLIEQIADDVYTVHHYSLVAMLLRLHEIDPGEDFGVASSTLKHWKEEATCAQ